MADFSPELVARIKDLWKRYPEKKAAILPAMHLIQKERGGWFSPETIRDTAELFGVSDIHVQGIVGFYDKLTSQLSPRIIGSSGDPASRRQAAGWG